MPVIQKSKSFIDSAKSIPLMLGYSEYLQSWQWEWYATLTIPIYETSNDTDWMQLMRLRWTRKLCTMEHIQVGYFYAFEQQLHTSAHFHLVMLGKGRKNKTLLNVDRQKWENRWPHRAEIRLVDLQYLPSLAAYLSGHLESNISEIDCYNLKLLKKKMIRGDI
jgi:hypothetical protein